MNLHKTIIKNQIFLKFHRYNYINIFILFNLILFALHFLIKIDFYLKLIIAILLSTIHTNKDISIGIENGTLEQCIFYPHSFFNAILYNIIANFIINLSLAIFSIIFYSLFFYKVNILDFFLIIIILYITTTINFIFESIFINIKIFKIFLYFIILTIYAIILVYIIKYIYIYSILTLTCATLLITHLLIKFAENNIKKYISKN